MVWVGLLSGCGADRGPRWAFGSGNESRIQNRLDFFAGVVRGAPGETFAQKITEGSLGRVSLPFLRPFNGCVPQPEKKRRLFDSHNPNSLMVAELRALYQRQIRMGISSIPKAKKSI